MLSIYVFFLYFLASLVGKTLAAAAVPRLHSDP